MKVLVLLIALAGCATPNYDEQFVTERVDGKPAAWVIGPSKTPPQADRKFISRPAI